ncbi:MAG: sugar ABC transporter permease [Eubacteriales bacterium]|nr:sugar ABC transporter permease [Eubacteriales bacterium]
MNIKSGLHKRKTVDNLVDIAFCTPQLTLYFLFTLLPFLIAVPMVLTDYASFLDHNVKFVGLQNFISIFRSPVIDQLLPALGRTAVFTVVNYATLFIFSLPLALAMFEMKSRMKKAYFTVIFLPLMLSAVGLGMLMSMMFSVDTGSLNLLLKELGFINKPLDIKDPSITAVILPLLSGWRYAGYNMALFLSGLLSIPTETIDAGKVDGVNYWQRVRYVYLPQIIPNITIATILCLLGSFAIFDECIGLGALQGNQSAFYLSVFIYRMGFSSAGGGGSASAGTLAQGVAISLVVYMPLMILAFVLNKLQKKMQY